MGKDEYTTTRGALKLKGVKGAGVDKHKRKKKRPKVVEGVDAGSAQDGAVLEAESAAARDDGEEIDDDGTAERDVEAPSDAVRATLKELQEVGKTEAERRHEETRRRRLADRLAREGVKTHKERVEELNKYLSTLSEHHDMPRIGPG